MTTTALPSLEPIIEPSRIRPDQTYPIEYVHEVTGLSRAELKRMYASGEIVGFKNANCHIRLSGLSILIRMGLPPPAPVVPPATETPTDRRSRGNNATDDVINPKPKKKGK